MDNLPPKLLRDIINLAATTQPFSYKPHLSPYTAVSRKWQHLVEPKQFSCMRINNDDIDTFATVFGDDAIGEHRKASLQQLFLRVYSSLRSTKPRIESTIDERKDEVIANDTAFSKNFANQLLNLRTLCPALTTLEFVFTYAFPSRDPIIEVPSVLLPYTSIDHLCVSLRKLCQSMQRVVLGNLPISTQLFWPLQDDDEASEDDEPFWPKLTHFDLEFSICAAEGGLWADLPTLPSCSCRAGLKNTPDEKHQSERPAQTFEAPSPSWPSEELEGLFFVIAKAIARMPMLQNFRARVGKSSYLDLEDQGFGMRYSSPTEEDIGNDGTILAKRLYWMAPPGWRMSGTLEEQWASILGNTGVRQDAATDAIAHVVLRTNLQSTVHYQDCDMFTAPVRTVKLKSNLNNEEIARTAAAVTSELTDTVQSLLESGSLPPGRYYPYASMKAIDTTVVFECNPLGTH
ncbi:hypothetical protein KCU71_g1925, partial [Aureobasidium melanogenum]